MRVFLAICTHTWRHLAACLGAAALQRPAPRAVVVSIDVDDRAIIDGASEAWRRLGCPAPLVIVSRPHQGEARLNQVRNNALRALDERFELRTDDRVVMIDGDVMLLPGALARHAEARGFGVTIAYRANLTQEETDQVLAGTVTDSITLQDAQGLVHRASIHASARDAELRARQVRYERQLLARRLGFHRLGLLKAHKPKILGGHHAARVKELRLLNGYDEEYVGYGFDDDDLTRRLYALRPAVSALVAITSTPAAHLWHPTRASASPLDSSGAARFSRKDLPPRCVHGWQSARHQAPVNVAFISA